MAQRSQHPPLISSRGIELARKQLQEIFQGDRELLSQSTQVSRSVIDKFFAGKSVGIKSAQLICKSLMVNWQEVAELSKDEILPTSEEELNDILGRIIKGGNLTEVDKKNLQNWLDGGQQVVSQLGKYAVSLGQAQDIHIGDRIYKDADAKLIRQIIKELQSFNQTEVHQPVKEPVQKHVSIQELRQKIGVYIQEQCGKMKILDMEQPLDLNDIYISVNVLEKLTSHRRLEIEELLNDFDLKRFGQAGLGKVREPRVPGLEAAKRYTKLMVLGKPGAGKTTFLKHLAMQSCVGDFLADHLPLFITLKDFAETPKQPNLFDYICQILTQLHSDDVEVINVFSKLLQDGKTLLLLDGLDEVREKDSSRILRNIKNFVAEHSNNRYIVTCRIAAQEYNFEQFTEVEVADFSSEQIKSFSDRWFKPKHPTKAEKFIAKVEESQNIRELAANPLLLTLLCLIFEDQGKFKNSRSELYEEGIELLLERWDDSRDIERDQIYRKLSTKRKKDLLSQIALKTFTRNQYFFKQRVLEDLISEYIQNLPELKSSSETLLVSARKVLKSVEAQHSLLVERAKGIYSFSHLTFQEFFVARKFSSSIVETSNTLQDLVEHVTDFHWRQVFLLTSEMLSEADILFNLMKERIDSLVIGDEEIIKFLDWIMQQSISRKNSFNPVAIRAFILARTLYLDLELANKFHLETSDARALDREVEFQRWQFNEKQEELLLQYYEASKLLIDCLNTDCYVSNKIREDIQLNLLSLP